MAYCRILATRVRFSLEGIEGIKEYDKDNRLTFFLKGKALLGIIEKDLICRISPLFYDEISSMECCKKASFITPSNISIVLEKNIVSVSSAAIQTKKQLTFWMDHCLLAHPEAPKKKRRKKRQRRKNLRRHSEE
jgi:hypothetical protein